MKAWIVKLAAELLDEYADRLGNDGCNDYVVPDYVPLKELWAALKEWNDADSDEDNDGLEELNWAVVRAVANELRKEQP